jgi:hemerythrin-like domain-containing protein
MAHHRQLDALFLEHQEALVGLELERAQERLALYRESLRAHMDFEDACVIPLYARLPRVRGGGEELFTGEHARLRELLDDVSEIVEPLGRGSADLRRRVVHAFDRSALFKALLEHHDLREGQLLYPRLAAALPAEEARALVEAAPRPGELVGRRA